MKNNSSKSELSGNEEGFSTKYQRMDDSYQDSNQDEQEPQASSSSHHMSFDNPPISDYISLLHAQLVQTNLNVQEIGRIITEGINEKAMGDAELLDLAKMVSKNFNNLGNIHITSLASNLNKGLIDSRFVLVGHAFLWNLIKISMTNVRDKFDNYNYKISAIAESCNAKMDFNSKNVISREFVIRPEACFVEIDMLDVYNSLKFRKGQDLNRKAKQIIKSYFISCSMPRCAIWHYGLRLSGSSHKKSIQDIPSSIVYIISDFLITMTGLGRKEFTLDFNELDQSSIFYESLGDTDETREMEFENLKILRDNLNGKFRTFMAESLNEIREMPYNLSSKQLQAPPRGKPMEENCVTWRQYEDSAKLEAGDRVCEPLKPDIHMESRVQQIYNIRMFERQKYAKEEENENDSQRNEYQS